MGFEGFGARGGPGPVLDALALCKRGVLGDTLTVGGGKIQNSG